MGYTETYNKRELLKQQQKTILPEDFLYDFVPASSVKKRHIPVKKTK